MPQKTTKSKAEKSANTKRRKDKPPALKLIGQRLREVRFAQGFSSQDAFAYSCGIDRAYYSALERGERDVGILKLIQIAKGLGVEVAALIPSIEALSTPDSATDEQEVGKRVAR
ncbi:MAG: helix-turn-helix transcriptional regulator [Gammaproteobacteria bacterium]|nr:helix-turn-helix transcriptional regulator [Gammaproteobacteria bacterium]